MSELQRGAMSLPDQIRRVNVAHNTDNLREIEAILREANGEAVSARREVQRIAQSLLAVELDDLRKQGTEVSRWTSSQWSRWIVLMLQSRGAQLAQAANPRLLEELRTAQAQIAALQDRAREAGALAERLRVAESEIAAKQSAINQLQQKHATLSRQHAAQAEELEDLRHTSPPVEVGARDSVAPGVVRLLPASPDEPVWLQSARVAPDFQPVTEVLYVLGRYGDCLRTALEGHLAALGPGRRRDTTLKCFDTLEGWGWLKSITSESVGRGRTPQLYCLTAQGAEAYRRLFGDEACEQQYTLLLKRHKTPAHVLLNLKAAELLERHGATIALYPDSVLVSDTQTYQPDLIAVMGGQTVYVECETMSDSDVPPTDRSRKWDGYRTVTDTFHIIVPNQEAQQRLYNEIAQWQVRSGQVLDLCICNLNRALESDTLWTFSHRLST